MVTGGPPETSTFCRVFRFPGEEKNAICRPSGDQKGKRAPEPGMGISVAVAAFRGRTKSLPLADLLVAAVKAMRSPSRDTAGRSEAEKVSLSGRGISQPTATGLTGPSHMSAA